MKPKVLFTASTGSHIMNFHIPYLKHFSECGWVVHVAAQTSVKAIPYADKVFPVPFRKSMLSAQNLKATSLLRRAVKEENYSLIITHTSLAAFFTRFALKGLAGRPPVVNVVHGYLFDEGSSPMRKRLFLGAEQLAAPETDLLLTMNKYDFELANQYHLGKKIVHIPGMGVDFSRLDSYLSTVNKDMRVRLRRGYGIPPEAFVIVYAAEFSKRKSQSVLIHAMQMLPERAVLVLAGEGTLRPECETLAKKLGVSHRILFPGHVKDMGVLYGMADVAAASSRSEGLPFNVMEAMYAGLPVVASDVKGHVDLIQDGVNGLIYPYGNVENCAAKLNTLIESEHLRGRLSQNAKADSARYSLKRVLPEVVDWYAAACPSGSRLGFHEIYKMKNVQ